MNAAAPRPVIANTATPIANRTASTAPEATPAPDAVLVSNASEKSEIGLMKGLVGVASLVGLVASPLIASALIPPAAGIFAMTACAAAIGGGCGAVLDALGKKDLDPNSDSKHSGLITGAVVGGAWIASVPFMALGTGLLGVIGLANLAAAAAGKVPEI